MELIQIITEILVRIISEVYHLPYPELRIHHRAGPLPPYMRNKPILIAIVMVSSSLAGCTSDNSEEDLSARYQEGYDAGYGDAYDASYDGVASTTTTRVGMTDGG